MLKTSPYAFGCKSISMYICMYMWQNLYMHAHIIKIFQWLQVSKKKKKKNDSYLTLYKNQESVFNKSHLVYLILRNVTLLLFNS